jgi:hypothetical protein
MEIKTASAAQRCDAEQTTTHRLWMGALSELSVVSIHHDCTVNSRLGKGNPTKLEN